MNQKIFMTALVAVALAFIGVAIAGDSVDNDAASDTGTKSWNVGQVINDGNYEAIYMGTSWDGEVPGVEFSLKVNAGTYFVVAQGTPTTAGTYTVKVYDGSTLKYTCTITVTDGTYTCYLHYNGNAANATGGVTDDSFTSSSINDHTFTVKSGQYYRTNYAFLGWSLDSGAETATYHAGDSISVPYNGSKTLYAIWAYDANTTTVIHYDGNGVTLPPTVYYDQTYTGTAGVSKTFTIHSGKPTWSGHTFLGWSDDSSATDAKYSPGDSITLVNGTQLTLYAIWSTGSESGSGSGGETVVSYTSPEAVDALTKSVVSYKPTVNVAGSTFATTTASGKTNASWLSFSNGTLSGTAPEVTAKTTYYYSIKATTPGGQIAIQTVSFDVYPIAKISTAVKTSYAFNQNTPITDITLSGNVEMTWGKSGDLPAGLTLSGNKISGTPTNYGEFTITLKGYTIQDAGPAQTATKKITFTVAEKNLSITSTAPTDTYYAGKSYRYAPTSSIETGVTWTIKNNPDWLVCVDSEVIGSIPSDISSTTVTYLLMATSSSGQQKTQDCTINVEKSAAFTTVPTAACVVFPVYDYNDDGSFSFTSWIGSVFTGFIDFFSIDSVDASGVNDTKVDMVVGEEYDRVISMASEVVSGSVPGLEFYTKVNAGTLFLWAKGTPTTAGVYNITTDTGTSVITVYETAADVPAPDVITALVYHANGGSGAPDIEKRVNTKDFNFQISSTVPTYTDFKFLGWGNSNTDTEAVYHAGDYIYVDEGTYKHLYAVWERTKWTESSKTFTVGKELTNVGVAVGATSVTGSIPGVTISQTTQGGTLFTVLNGTPTTIGEYVLKTNTWEKITVKIVAEGATSGDNGSTTGGNNGSNTGDNTGGNGSTTGGNNSGNTGDAQVTDEAQIIHEKNTRTFKFVWTGSDAERVIWNFGDGSEEVTGNTVYHTYSKNGEYKYTVYGVNTVGSSEKLVGKIIVDVDEMTNIISILSKNIVYIVAVLIVIVFVIAVCVYHKKRKARDEFRGFY